MVKHTIVRKIVVAFWLPVALFILFSLVCGKRFLSLTNLLVILQQSIAPTIIVWAMCFTMTMSIFDLTLGVVIILAGILGTVAGTGLGYPGLLLGGIATGAVIGSVNGIAFLGLRIPSIIVTVGMVMIAEVLAVVYTNAGGVYLPAGLERMARIPYNLVVIAVCAVIVYYLFTKTALGLRMRAIGSSERIASHVGVNVRKTKFLGFVICGAFAGLAGVLYQSYGRYVEPLMGMASLALIFTPLTGFFYALSVSGAINIIVAVVIGQITITLLMNGLIIVGFPSAVQQIVVGVMLIIVIAFNARKSDAVVK